MPAPWIRDLPIQRKLAVVVLGTCSIVLLFACTALAVLHLVQARSALAGEMTLRARVLGQGSRAALTFEDEVEAAAQLRALEVDPHVLAARLFDDDGGFFAEYSRAGARPAAAPGPGPDGARFAGGELVVVEPVLLDGRRIGSVQITTGLERVYGELWIFGALAGMVALGSLAGAAALSTRLQRSISGPVVALARTARAVAERKDFALRAPRAGDDEVGQLADSFNDMLGEIEARERALREANEALRAENAERRRADARVQAQLARLELLHHITQAIGERQDLRSIFQVVVSSVEDHLPLDLACVCEHDAATGLLVVTDVGESGRRPAARLGIEPGGRFALDADGLDRCLEGSLVYEPDTARLTSPFARGLAAEGLRSMVLAPLQVEGRVLGVLVGARRAADALDSGECQFLRQLSEHVALAAHQASLHVALQQAYDDLRQSQQAALQQERLRALGQMASGVAHDINNAVAPIAIYAGMLLEGEPRLSAAGRASLETIQRAIGDVAETVARMREFSRPRAAEAKLAPVDVNALVRQAVELTRARWSSMPQERGVVVRLRTELAEDLPRIAAVDSELRDVLTNLIFNAVDAMPEGGTVTLGSFVDPATDGRSRAQVRIEVTDTGVGMDEQTRERCLEPFFTTKGERGTGLGLAMVYGTLQRHHAELEIDSTPGQGTTIRMAFPSVVPTGQGPAAVTPDLSLPPGLRVLVVDDDPLVLGAVATAFERDGHEVVAAGGGREGVEAFRAAHAEGRGFAVVISDLGMPYVDGRQVAAAVKTMSATTPVVMLTGWGDRANEELPANVDRVLGKPARLRDLRQAVAELLRRPGA